jgi:hypothetical protein
MVCSKSTLILKSEIVVSAITLGIETSPKMLKAIENMGIKSNNAEDFVDDFITAERREAFLYFDSVFFK